MKHLKKSVYLLIILAFTLSCGKETVVETEILNNVEPKTDLREFQSFSEAIDSGFDFKANQENLLVQTNKVKKVQSKEANEVSGLILFTDEEEFNNYGCSVLILEDFEEATISSEAVGFFSTALDYQTDNDYFSPGDIQSGFEVTSSTNDEPLEMVVLGDNFLGLGNSKIVGPNVFNENLIINFSKPNVNIVGMDILTNGNVNTVVNIYGSQGLIASTNINTSLSETFIGFIASESITQIVLVAGEGIGELIDNISFGSIDSDCDGVLNENDPYPYSNTSEYVNIDGCYPDVENIFVELGTTMVDQIDSLIKEINLQYDGENWDELHQDFTRELAKITYYWRKDRLITRSERSAITSCGWSSQIPYFNAPE